MYIFGDMSIGGRIKYVELYGIVFYNFRIWSIVKIMEKISGYMVVVANYVEELDDAGLIYDGMH